ncbi:MAG: 30S ribosomal protein S20 [Pirellulales bacterium]
MPTTKSASKRLRQSETRRARNRSIKRTLSTYIRRVTESIAAGDVAKSEADFRLVSKKIDQAASKKIVHANTAARTKSRLSARIKRLKQAAPA